MRLKRAIHLWVTVLFPQAVLLYAGLIAIICWAHWRLLHGFQVNLSANKILLFFFFMGLLSNVLLLGAALDKVIEALKGHGRPRLRQGIGKIGWYLLTQLFLYDVPLQLYHHGGWLMKALGFFVFFGILSLLLVGLLYSRYQGIPYKGVSVCAP